MVVSLSQVKAAAVYGVSDIALEAVLECSQNKLSCILSRWHNCLGQCQGKRPTFSQLCITQTVHTHTLCVSLCVCVLLRACMCVRDISPRHLVHRQQSRIHTSRHHRLCRSIKPMISQNMECRAVVRRRGIGREGSTFTQHIQVAAGPGNITSIKIFENDFSCRRTGIISQNIIIPPFVSKGTCP